MREAVVLSLIVFYLLVLPSLGFIAWWWGGLRQDCQDG